MTTTHPDHCRACKERVHDLLKAVCGPCSTGHQFSWPARPEPYATTIIGATLERTRSVLGDWRGQRDFIKSAQVPPCDFFVSDPPFILEFDESQHFSTARFMTLSCYPDTLRLGFSRARWQALCREINARDDQPIDRDERRAWYDALRDLIPQLHGFQPTIRLFAGDYAWCTLDAADPKDRDLFAAMIHASAG
jgi:hypothetical protein